MILAIAAGNTVIIKPSEMSFHTSAVLKDFIDELFDENEVYDEMNQQELQEFIEQMTTDQFEKVQDFFDTMPKLRHTVEVENPKTGVVNTVHLEGMQSFLA